MSGFESPVVNRRPELSPEDQKVMSRRSFLKAAGIVAGAAALGVAAPEVFAAERAQDNCSFRNFELTPFQRESLAKNLERKAPGARAEFTLNGPGASIGGERLVWINVIVVLRDGTEKRGKGTAFYPPRPDTIETMA